MVCICCLYSSPYLSSCSSTSTASLTHDSPIPDMENFNLAGIVVPVAAVALCYHYMQSNRRKLPYPPSPKADPLIGHLRKLPMGNEHIAYRNWGRELNSTSSHQHSNLDCNRAFPQVISSCSGFRVKHLSSLTLLKPLPTYSKSARENTLEDRISLWLWIPSCTSQAYSV